MPLMDKITKATQDMVRSTKDATDIARQNSLIAEDQKAIENLYSQIGKLFVETQEPDPDSPLGKLVLAVNAAYSRIEKCHEAIQQIKGTKKCPSCDKDIPISSVFCGECGAKLEVPAQAGKKFCSKCGKDMPEDGAFCTACGHKQE